MHRHCFPRPLNWSRFWSLISTATFVVTWMLGQTLVAAEISFSRDIRPLLSDRCFECHGPDEDHRAADLRLDVAKEAESALSPGDLDASEVWARITSTDPDYKMPPPTAKKPAFTASELAMVQDWIQSGAPYEDFWAFVPLAEPQVPGETDDAWSDQPIDRYVHRQLAAEHRSPTESASKRTLIRRLSFDLTGLPPTRQEIQAFLNDTSEDAYGRLVDDLMSRPQFGEHMARFWLDLVRFADTNGMHKDFYRNFVTYRDWVIRAFNENLGYDDFVRYQLAGDLYDAPTVDQQVASGFNRLHLIIDVGTALPEESHFKNVLDRVSAVGTVFFGMTVQCAQCHSHKYDPITQEDYYSLFAFFNNVDAKPETVNRPRNGLQAPFISLATPEQQQTLADFDQRVQEQQAEIRQVQDRLKAVVRQLEDASAQKENTTGGEAVATEEQTQEKQSLEKQLKSLQANHQKLKRERDRFDDAIAKAMVMKERDTVRATFVMERGQYDAPLKDRPVQRNTPAFLFPLEKEGDVATRMDLANWFLDPRHPLTARVAVNRFWQQFFGVGIVKTSEDLGSQGDVPSHPELLDYLAWSFIDSGWDVKALVKQIVMSKTYQQLSIASVDAFREDPENRKLTRGPRYRLDAEVLRDQILATSGLLSRKIYGRSVKPPQPTGLWKSVSMTNQVYRADQGDDVYRRSLYTFWKRAMPPPQMTILNAPGRDACVARRERTNTPSQALLLLNEPEYLKAARHLAQQVILEAESSTDRVQWAYESVTGKLPDEPEQATLLRLQADLQENYAQSPEMATKVCEGLGMTDANQQAELAAWTMVVNTLFNLDITKNKD